MFSVFQTIMEVLLGLGIGLSFIIGSRLAKLLKKQEERKAHEEVDVLVREAQEEIEALNELFTQEKRKLQEIKEKERDARKEWKALEEEDKYMRTIFMPFQQNLKSAMVSEGQLKPLDSKSPKYKYISTYFENSQHTYRLNQWGCKKLKLIELYKFKQFKKRITFKEKYIDYNKILLWHGTGMKCLSGIAEIGLKPGVKGHLGPGIYFSDRVSKSAQYCHELPDDGRHIKEGINFILLCQVAVGNMYELKKQNETIKQPLTGYDSICGVGNFISDPNGDITLENGMLVPTGKTIPNPKCNDSFLDYPEYVVNDPGQSDLKYLLVYDALMIKPDAIQNIL